jgi:hypothetical protein
VTELRNTIPWRKADNERGGRQPKGREDNNVVRSQKPRKEIKRRNGDCNVVGALGNMMMTTESQRFKTTVVEDMKVGDLVRVSWAGLRNGRKLWKGFGSLDRAHVV